MEYISHEDYKKMLTGFGKEVPKAKLNEGLEKEGRYNDQDATYVEDLSDELIKLFKAGKISNQQHNDADDYLNDHGYELWVDSQTGSNGLDTILKHVGADIEEGNAFTAGLAKTKKGGEFKVGDKEFKDRTNYDAPMSEASGDIEKLKQEIKTEYGHGGSILSFANPHKLAQIAKISPKASKALEAMNNMMPEDLEIEDLKPALKVKVEKIESSILRELGVDLENEVEEGNAFTAGLAKTKKGGEFKVGDKSFKDRTNYDASVSEELDSPYDGGADDLAAMAKDAAVDAKLTKIAGLYTNKAIKHAEIEKIVNALTGQGHEVNARYVQEFLKNHDVQLDEYHPDDPAGQDSAAARGEDGDEGVEEGAAEILGHIKGDIYKVKTPKGEVIDLEFELERGDRTDDYGYEGNLVSYDDDYEYILPVALVPMGGGDYDINPYYVEFTTIPLKKKGVQEYQFDQMYPDDPGPFEGIEQKLKEFLAKEDDVNWDRMDDEEAEENETDNGIEEDEMEEDINLPSSQPTGPSIEEKRSRLAHLTSEERDQLKQYVETIKTVKMEIKKMVGKQDMEEGGDNTNLIMKPTTVSEDGGGEHEEIESNLDPKVHDAFHKIAGMAVKSLMKAGIEPDQIKAFFQHEISELPDFVTNQYEE